MTFLEILGAAVLFSVGFYCCLFAWGAVRFDSPRWLPIVLAMFGIGCFVLFWLTLSPLITLTFGASQ